MYGYHIVLMLEVQTRNGISYDGNMRVVQSHDMVRVFQRW